MRFIKFLLFIVMLVSLSASAQNVNVSGSIECFQGTQAGGLFPYVIMEYDSMECCTGYQVLSLDSEGSFYFSFPLYTQEGDVTIWYYDGQANYVSAEDSWQPDSLEVEFFLTACPNQITCGVDITLTSESVQETEDGYFVYLFSETSGLNPSYQWTFGDGTASSEESPTHMYTAYGSYTICLTLYGQDNCTATDCLDLTVSNDGTIDGPGMAMQGFTLIVNGQISGIDEASSSDMQLFPNPVTENTGIHLRSSQPVKANVKLFSAAGQLIQDFMINLPSGSSALPVDVSALPGGLYKMMIVETSGATTQLTLVK